MNIFSLLPLTWSFLMPILYFLYFISCFCFVRCVAAFMYSNSLVICRLRRHVSGFIVVDFVLFEITSFDIASSPANL